MTARDSRRTKTRGTRDRRIVVDGRWYSAAAIYAKEMGERALERATALPDPAKLLRRPVEAHQLSLLDRNAYRSRKPSAEEAYAKERLGVDRPSEQPATTDRTG
jgi:hypothetical protein